MSLGLDALLRPDGTGHALAALDYRQHLVRGSVFDAALFAQARGGAANRGDGWRPEASLLAGAALTWSGNP